MDIYKFYGENSKKQREGSLDKQKSPDEVFEESLDSPNCVKILFNCMKNIEKKLEVLDYKLKPHIRAN